MSTRSTTSLPHRLMFMPAAASLTAAIIPVIGKAATCVSVGVCAALVNRVATPVLGAISGLVFSQGMPRRFGLRRGKRCERVLAGDRWQDLVVHLQEFVRRVHWAAPFSTAKATSSGTSTHCPRSAKFSRSARRLIPREGSDFSPPCWGHWPLPHGGTPAQRDRYQPSG